MVELGLSVIIPAYNEANRITETLMDYYEFLSRTNMSFEIFVVLNGCRDNTLQIVQEFASKYPQIRYKNYPEAIGKGGAIIEGYRLAQGNLISFADADGSTKIEELYKLMQNMGNYDGVIGSRWLEDSNIIVPQPFIRRITSRGFNILVRLVLGLPYRDTQCGGKIFKRVVIESILPELRITNFAFDACMLYEVQRKQFKVKELPITWSDDQDTTLVLRKAIPGMLLAIIKARLSHSRFFRRVAK